MSVNNKWIPCVCHAESPSAQNVNVANEIFSVQCNCNSAVIRGFKEEFCCVFSIHFSLCIPLAAKGNTVSSCTSTTDNTLLLLYSFETAKIITVK